MESKHTGYQVKEYRQPVKRYCQTLDLVDDPALMEEYKKCHSKENFWKEIGDGIKSVGILDMQIYQLGTRLFMIVETPLDFDWDSAFKKLATLPRQAEWEEKMSVFQKTFPGATSAEKWQLMEKIFCIYN